MQIRAAALLVATLVSAGCGEFQPLPKTETAPPAASGPIAPVAARLPAGSLAPLCPSVMLWDDASRELAPKHVNRVAELLTGVPPDRRWVQLVPTLHARLNDDLSIAEYGVMIDRHESWQSTDNFRAADDGLAGRLRDAFARAIGQAVRRGLHVAILPHLDPAAGIEEWRNLYRFAPGERIGAGSYESLLIEPLADAIEAQATRDTRIDLALSGEMGRSLFEHPDEYLALLRRLRERFTKNPRTAGVRIGVSLNWDGVSGPLAAGQIDKDRINPLFSECDFVGMSCYAPVSVPPTAADFRRAVARFLEELAPYRPGSDLFKERLVISEIGIGGGNDPGGVAVPSVEEVAARPHEGKGAGRGYWWEASLARLRRQYHRALCEYLTEGEVRRAFLWSEGPWDPQGVTNGRRGDKPIISMIHQHNRTAEP